VGVSRRRVVLEATYGWYWAADVLADAGATVHLAHPLGVKGFSYRRVKNDERDAADLADLLRMGQATRGVDRTTGGAWSSRGDSPSQQALSRSGRGSKLRFTLSWPSKGCGCRLSDLLALAGRSSSTTLRLDAHTAPGSGRLRRLIDAFTFEIDIVTKRNSAQLKTHPGFQAIQAIRGVGPVLAAIFVAEIGDVSRFARPEQLCAWAGMTPKHRESDTKVHRGRITKQGQPVGAVGRGRSGADPPRGSARARPDSDR